MKIRSQFTRTFHPAMTKETIPMTRPVGRTQRIRPFLLLALLALAVIGASASTAAAAEPHLRVTPLIPDHVVPGAPFKMYVTVHNDGGAPMSGLLTLAYTFPVGVAVPGTPNAEESPEASCLQSGQEDTCTIDVTGIPAGHRISYRVSPVVEATASGELAGQVEVSGGGAPNTVTAPFSLDTEPLTAFGIKAFEVAAAAGTGLLPSQAGGHPADLATAFELDTASVGLAEPLGSVLPENWQSFYTRETFRDVVVHTPAGLVGNPLATASRCTSAELNVQNPAGQYPICPRDSQIGTALLIGKDISPIYNVVPPRGVPAAFAFFYQGVIINLDAKLRPADNGVDIVTAGTPDPLPIPKFEVDLWGTPADSSHDNLRAECTESLLGANGSLCPTFSRAQKPFLRQPTSCTGNPLHWEIEMDTYQHPGVYHRKATSTPALTGCDSVPFEPKVSLAPTDSSAHTTSGLGVDLSVPQDSGPNGIADADVRKVSLALPQGFGLNPAAAEGLTACSDAQLRIGLEVPAECPEASKLGTVEVDTPLLEEPLGGSVYLRSQNSQDPESGEMYRLAIVLHSAERGVDVKLPGSLVVDKATGQLKTTFDELPQLPFETMHLDLKSGPRAPLTTPQACGSYAAQATLTGWNGKTVDLAPGFRVDQGCTQPGFAPGFEAGVRGNTAGEFSPFTLRVTRGAGQPNLSRIAATLPEGELAKLKGVPLCGDAAAATGACPAGSQIGKVVAAVGEGSSPLYLPQPGKSPTAVFLAGPYKGAPFSVVAEVPAQSGPFDLGTVTVRSALRIDPLTTRATVASDPLPQIFGGIPVSYRDVRVEVDRPQFTISPTDCEPMSADGTIGAASGASADVSARFQVADCGALAFKPKLSLRLKGKTRRGGNPALTAVLTMPQKGANANVARTVVSLPHSEFLAQSHINTSCTRVQYAAGAGGGAGCPKGSVYGRARAFSPLLDKPLEGNVYLRSNGGERELPDLVASLDGAIHVDLVGYVDSDKKTGGLRTTFAKVPDAPVSKFVLELPGGRKSLLENSTDICRGTHRAIVKMDGQNGRIADFNPKLRVAGCGAKSKRHR